MGLEMGKRSLMYHQTGLRVIGHNLSNADVDGYSRQRVKAGTLQPLYNPSLNRAERPGQLGQGVELTAIKRDRDIYLESQITTQLSKKEYWSSKHFLINQVEDIHHALGDVNLRERLDRFWSGWQELSKNPSEPAVREALVQDSLALATGINDQFNKLNRMRRELEEKIIADTQAIGDISKSLADINTRILQSEALKDNPNDLKDERDRLIKQLAQIIDIRVNFKDNDEVMVFLGGKILVQGTEHSPLELRANQNNEGLSDIYFSESGDRFIPKFGRLNSYFEIRDDLLQDQIKRLDNIAINLTQTVNELHQLGFDLYGSKGRNFFNVITAGTDPLGDFDLDGDGTLDSTMLYKIKGTQNLTPISPIGEDGVLTFEDVRGNQVSLPYFRDQKIEDLLTAINGSDANVNAYLDYEGRLVFKSKSSLDNYPFYIRHLEDSGRFLSGVAGVLQSSSVEGAFDFQNIGDHQKLEGGIELAERTPFKHPAAWIGVDKRIIADANHIAAAGGTDYDGLNGPEVGYGVGDGEIALSISDLRFSKIMIDEKETLKDYYISMISDPAVKGKTAEFETKKYQAVMEDLQQISQSISGVNIDEEMTNMLAMQHGYQAAARMVTVMDNMLDVVINRMAI